MLMNDDDNEGEEKVVPSLRRCFVDGDGVADLVVHGGHGARHVHALDNVHHLVRSPWHHGEYVRRRDNASHALSLSSSGFTEFNQRSEDNTEKNESCSRTTRTSVQPDRTGSRQGSRGQP